jgi:hypothetical protein
MTSSTRPGNWVARVRQFVRPRDIAEEHCDLCAAPIPPDHRHLVEPGKRRLLCACRECLTLLGDRDDRRYRAVPESARLLEDFRMTDTEWDAFGIPISLAFFLRSTPQKRVVAFYLGPAGPTESLLDLEAWGTLTLANPVLGEIEPDVEALLVNRVNHAREYYRAPIDVCYALAGLIRTKWRGLSGGEEARREIDGFLARLRERPDSAGVLRHG